jgi:hypothetical protein
MVLLPYLSLLHVSVYVTLNLLIVLVQIANKWDLKKNNAPFYAFSLPHGFMARDIVVA